MRTPCYIQREGEAIADIKKKMKDAGLSMMSTKEACAKDIHPMRHRDEDKEWRCSFCNVVIDTSKECSY